MVEDSERLKVLKMVQEGKITADEAVQLLETLEKSGAKVNIPEPNESAKYAGKFLLVRVTDLKTNKKRVNVRLPLSIVNTGLKMGVKFAPQMKDIDTEELMKAIQSGGSGQIVDVEDLEDGEHVEVFIE
jgi:hypothetical protein